MDPAALGTTLIGLEAIRRREDDEPPRPRRRRPDRRPRSSQPSGVAARGHASTGHASPTPCAARTSEWGRPAASLSRCRPTLPASSRMPRPSCRRGDVVEIRRRLHRRPEIGLDLPETQALIVDELEPWVCPALGRSLSSVTALVDGGAPGPTVLLRADMDALPVEEATGLEFASEIAGAMHACGHDTHVTMLLGAARLLVERRAGLAGRVLLDFQPGEEGRHGARLMLEEGLLDVPTDADFGPVVGAFAIHITARYSTGTINFRPGAAVRRRRPVHDHRPRRRRPCLGAAPRSRPGPDRRGDRPGAPDDSGAAGSTRSTRSSSPSAASRAAPRRT